MEKLEKAWRVIFTYYDFSLKICCTNSVIFFLSVKVSFSEKKIKKI